MSPSCDMIIYHPNNTGIQYYNYSPYGNFTSFIPVYSVQYLKDMSILKAVVCWSPILFFFYLLMNVAYFIPSTNLRISYDMLYFHKPIRRKFAIKIKLT